MILRARLASWFLKGSGAGVYDNATILEAQGTLWRLGLYSRYSGHLTNRYKAGARVRRGVLHAVSLLAIAKEKR